MTAGARRRTACWLAALACAGRVLGGPVETAARPFLWKVETPRASAFLLGSLHVAREDLYPLPDRVYRAFEESDRLVVEANPFSMEETALAGKMMARALRLEGESYSALLDPEVYRKLTEVAERHRLSAGSLDRLKPWYVAQLLGLLEMKRLGIDPEHGVDRHFIERAGAAKPVLELEGIERQLEFLDGFSAEEQRLMLEYTLRDLENLETNMAEITAAWKAGDAARLDTVLTAYLKDSPGLEGVFHRLFTERDRDMAARLDRLFAEGGAYFVVVGAGHLVTREGLLHRLGELGYQVKPVE